MPETISSKPIYQGRIFNARIDRIREGDVEYDREIVEHRGSAVIVPVFENGDVAMVRQYRYAAGKYLLEIPAGSLDEGEEPLTCAHRELEEEIGATAKSMRQIAEFYVSPGFLSEKMHVFLASDLTETQQNLEIDELLEVERIPLAEAAQMAKDGRIEDAKTIVGLMLASEAMAGDWSGNHLCLPESP